MDTEFSAKYDLSHDSVTIVNTLDEDPEHISEDGSQYQYQHGAFNVRKDKFSVGIVFRTVHTTHLYDESSDFVIPPDGNTNDGVHFQLGTDLNLFHSRLINLYHKKTF